MRLYLFVMVLFMLSPVLSYAAWPKEQQHYWKTVMPIMRKYCNQSCHNADDKKGGLNLNRYDFILTIQRDGHVFTKVIEQIESGAMPPEEKPQLSNSDKDTLLFYINKYLRDALNAPDPGLIPSRRLSNREYRYAIEDLTGIAVNTDSIFPRDPGGGEGFDNFSRTLYLTPLLMERYFEVGESVIEEAYVNHGTWRALVPEFRLSLSQRIKHWWYRFWHRRDISFETTLAAAKEAIFPFATSAYRRYLTPIEKQQLADFFTTVYQDQEQETRRYDKSVKEVFKAVLVSPHFLMRHEADLPKDTPYRISNFELASRLSFFLWSSIPDEQLLSAAYRENLHEPKVLGAQIERMLESPKVERMAESFATQWLEIDKLKDPTHEIDPEIFPEYDETLREAMHQEAVQYFYHVLTESRNMLELLDGEYTFVNEALAQHYGMEGIKGDDMRRVKLRAAERGGILGMAGVLTTTSLPNRTSPVLRGKWVMEKILATPAKPPPPNVPELEEAAKVHDEMTLRELLVIHRDKEACRGCHQDMDDLGFALENFDAVGRWRNTYPASDKVIDVSGSLKTGEVFSGAAELKQVLLQKKEQFAKGLAKKMLGFALGRAVVFKDTKTVEHLAETLLENDFDPVPFLQEVAMSYPFQFKKSDPVVVDNNFAASD